MDKWNNDKSNTHEPADRWTAAPDGWQLVEDNRNRQLQPRPVRDEIPAGTFHGGGGDGN